MNKLDFVEFSCTNFCFVAFYKPFQKWVSFEQDEEHQHLSRISLTDHFEDAEKFPTQWAIDLRLKNGYLDFGIEKNIKDFAIVKFKKTYTMVSNE